MNIEVKQKTVYVVNGEEFDTLKEVRTHLAMVFAYELNKKT